MTNPKALRPDKRLVFIDTEISPETSHIQDYGAIRSDGATMHTASASAFLAFVGDCDMLCGHNLLAHDLVHLRRELGSGDNTRILDTAIVVDTLPLSPLLFPKRPYHALVKDDKLQSDELNNPLNDAIKARDLFYDELEAFRALPDGVKRVYEGLLAGTPVFSGFFQVMDLLDAADNANAFDREEGDDVSGASSAAEPASPYLINQGGTRHEVPVETVIRATFSDQVCVNADLGEMIRQTPIELAYCLALIHAGDARSVMAPWLLHAYPAVEWTLHRLCGTPCPQGCAYCLAWLDPVKGLNRFFGYAGFRTFDGVPLQQQAVEAALNGHSLLAVFPTGGGKSITFQVPALMSGEAEHGLTVVISPLQSLMKDQVDNLEGKSITSAVTINGLLDPLERANALERAANGEANLLYISPESLRSRTVERLLLKRKIIRFVIDEAHCFSSWGQDFRVDYLYIAPFIRRLCEQKNLSQSIPVSCFTATAKQNVIQDILRYFREHLGLELQLFTADSARRNLTYRVIEREEEKKLETLRGLLEGNPCPTIIYVSRTKTAELLAKRLTEDGFPAFAYHGQMDRQDKTANQDAFIGGQIRIMVATSAFGMGVDKKDVGMVIHYDISNSLENYVQEAGRAGRDESLRADCYVLFNDEDLNKHFLLLNQTKISLAEIQQVWTAVKNMTRTRPKVSESALEIAQKAGWDSSLHDVETRVKTAISALEQAGYLRRGQNMPHVYADSLQVRTAMEAYARIRSEKRLNESEQQDAIRIVSHLVGQRSRERGGKDGSEARVDYLADILGLTRERVVHVVQLLREIGILADEKDLTSFMDETGTMTKSRNLLDLYREVEIFLLGVLQEDEKVVSLKLLNQQAEEAGIRRVTPDKIRTILNFWEITGQIERAFSRHVQHLMRVRFKTPRDVLARKVADRGELAAFILDYLEDRNTDNESVARFSVLELVRAWQETPRQRTLEEQPASPGTQVHIGAQEVETALLFLSRIGALRLEGGFLVVYNRLSLERLELDNRIKYKQEDYRGLRQYYEQKMEMIHIVGEYARRMMADYEAALQFVNDYFTLEYTSFKRKYFKGESAEALGRNLTPEKFRRVFGELSTSQLRIIQDKESPVIVVAAGPGSGKTRTLVHKLAALLLMEDVKHEQLLMLTFSRAAATEFKLRLMRLIGSAARFVEIKTFHSYCFDLLGRVGTLENSDEVVEQAVARIRSGEVDLSRITKAVLVIDEAQDLSAKEADLIEILIGKNEELRVIAVGDDDQNIYAFRGSDSRYFQALLRHPHAKLHELVQNYRARRNLVAFTNAWADRIPNRMKRTPVMPVLNQLGQIRVIQHAGKRLVVPVVNRMIREGVQGNTCILVFTNEDALMMAGLLRKKGVAAKLLQSVESYSLENLLEIRFFLETLNLSPEQHLISVDAWTHAEKILQDRFAKSRHLPMCRTLLRTFVQMNPAYRYVSDFMAFLRESGEEDFLEAEQGSLHVSTMHKAKGREFDQVVMLLDRMPDGDDQWLRLIYVAMTRARNGLTIHCGESCFGRKQDPPYRFIEGLSYERDDSPCPEPDCLLIQLSYRDVFLSFFAKTQQAIASLVGGDTLKIDDVGCLNAKGERVLLFSKRFLGTMQERRSKGFVPVEAKVNHILYWKEEEPSDASSDNRIQEHVEHLILFPEIEFRRT